MRGKIVINPFRVPNSSLIQANRLKEEFSKLGVKADITDSSELCANIADGELKTSLKDTDFVVYLDKDKYLSLALSKTGVKIFNSHESIRLCDDKAETYIALSDSGINIPKTVFGSLCYRKECKIDVAFAKKVIEEIGFPMVVKESFGSLGNGVYLVKNQRQLLKVMNKVKLKPHLFQEYLPYKFGTDVRVMVIGGKAVSSMERINEKDFRSNIAKGGKGKKIELSKEFKACAEKCAEILGLDYCGVDILYGKNGEPYLCEVNSNAFFMGSEKTTGINVAKLYAEYILKSLN